MKKLLMVPLVLGVYLSLTIFTFAEASIVVYEQPADFSGDGTLWASHNDTSGEFGDYSKIWDNFTLGSNHSITAVKWFGGYFFETNGAVDSFLIEFWADSSGSPGSLLGSRSIAGLAGETATGFSVLNLYPVYSYQGDFGTPFSLAAGTPYWVSIQALMDYPPQWGWFNGTGGDGFALQYYQGSNFEREDFAFALCAPIPEPSTFLLLGGGLAGLAFVARRRKKE